MSQSFEINWWSIGHTRGGFRSLPSSSTFCFQRCFIEWIRYHGRWLEKKKFDNRLIVAIGWAMMRVDHLCFIARPPSQLNRPIKVFWCIWPSQCCFCCCRQCSLFIWGIGIGNDLMMVNSSNALMKKLDFYSRRSIYGQSLGIGFHLVSTVRSDLKDIKWW